MEFFVNEHDVGSIRFSFLRYEGLTTDEEQIAALDLGQQLLVYSLRDEKKTVRLLELGSTYSIGAGQRARQAEWNREHRELIIRASLGIALIAKSAITRGVFTAVFWLMPPPIPHKVCSSLDAALSWAYALCASNGIMLSETARADCKAKLSVWQPRHSQHLLGGPRGSVG